MHGEKGRHGNTRSSGASIFPPTALDEFLLPLRPGTYPAENDVNDMVHARSGLPPLDAPRVSRVVGSAAQGLDTVRRTKSYAAKLYRRTVARNGRPVRMRRNPDDGSLQLVWSTRAARPDATIAQDGPSAPVQTTEAPPECSGPQSVAPGRSSRFAPCPNIADWRKESHADLRVKTQAPEYDQ